MLVVATSCQKLNYSLEYLAVSQSPGTSSQEKEGKQAPFAFGSWRQEMENDIFLLQSCVLNCKQDRRPVREVLSNVNRQTNAVALPSLLSSSTPTSEHQQWLHGSTGTL